MPVKFKNISSSGAGDKVKFINVSGSGQARFYIPPPEYVTVTIYAKQSGVTETLDLHFSTDGGITWDFAGTTFNSSTCAQIYSDAAVLKGSSLIFRFGSPKASKDSPKIPDGLEDSPSKLMVKFIDSIVRSPLDVKPTSRQDDRIRYQASSVTRYRLAFSQTLNITIPLNLNLSVGDVIELNIGVITKSGKKEKDIKKSGSYLISQLTHDFSTNRGLTGLQLTRDSYGNK